MDMITIREATAADLEPIYALICELEQCELSHAGFDHAFTLQRKDPRYRCLIAEQGGNAVAVSVYII